MAESLESAFRIRVADDYSPNLYIPNDVCMPLYTESVERVLSYRGSSHSGPVHLRVMLEWDSLWKNRCFYSTEEIPFEHTSASDLREEMKAGPVYSLERCLKDYIQPEFLEWTCRFCKRFQSRAKKTLMFYSLPDVLIVHLKRFKQLANGQQVKLDPVVSFPVRGLNLSKFTFQERTSTPVPLRRNSPQTRSLNGFWRKKHSQKPVTQVFGSKEWLNGVSDSASTPLYVDTGLQDGLYDLYAVCNHLGESMNSGHYTAFCRNPVDGLWRHFDDTSVTKVVDENKLVTSASYILFYERRDICRSDSSRNSAESGYSEHWFYGIPSAVRNSCRAITGTSNASAGLPSAKSAASQQEEQENAVNEMRRSQNGTENHNRINNEQAQRSFPPSDGHQTRSEPQPEKPVYGPADGENCYNAAPAENTSRQKVDKAFSSAENNFWSKPPKNIQNLSNSGPVKRVEVTATTPTICTPRQSQKIVKALPPLPHLTKNARKNDFSSQTYDENLNKIVDDDETAAEMTVRPPKLLTGNATNYFPSKVAAVAESRRGSAALKLGFPPPPSSAQISVEKSKFLNQSGAKIDRDKTEDEKNWRYISSPVLRREKQVVGTTGVNWEKWREKKFSTCSAIETDL